jgi:putative endonuclease
MAAKGLSRCDPTSPAPLAKRPGQAGEDLACAFLEAGGYRIRSRNFRCRAGELDVVAERAGVTVFVEVKERHGSSHGHGFEHVTWAKRRRVLQAARLYAAQHGLLESRLRFDVISIDWKDGCPGVRHDQGAFDGEGA